MHIPPLQLKDHIFPKVVLVAQPEAKDKIGQEGVKFGCGFNFDVKLLQATEDERAYQVQVQISSSEIKGAVFGYEIDVVIAGFFEVEKEFQRHNTPEKVQEMDSILGPTLLLGAAREFIYNLTSRGPYPSVYLPTVSFLPQAAQKTKGAAVSKEKRTVSKSKTTLPKTKKKTD